MNIRFYHGEILSMDGDLEIRPGEVWVEGNKITCVGTPRQEVLRQNPPVWDREIDVAGCLIMPGFKNAHTHSAMTFLRSYADDLPLQSWLHTQVFPMEAKLCPEDVRWLSKLAIMEYLTSGITANFDMYFHQEMTARASAECGFRTVMTSGLNDFTSSIAEVEDSFLRYNDYHELISYRLGFHAEYTTSEPLLRGVAALAEKYQAPVFTHLAETKQETEDCIRRNGKTPMGYLDSLGMFRYGGGIYHGVYMTEEDLDLARDRGVGIVTNPGSNTKLASGIAPISQMQARNILTAIGTDGPASNNCLDMFREMFLVTGLAKLREKDASAVPAGEVLSMAVSGGARLMGLSDCDCLAEGKLADLILIDLNQPNMQPKNNLVKNLVYSGSKQNVKLTMVNGRILYENGQFAVGEDPAEIYRMANHIIGRMRASFGSGC